MKKRLISLLLLPLLVGCGGCAMPEPSTSAPGEGLTMTMEHPIYDPSINSCVYFIHNDTEEAVDFGAAYNLQRWEGGRWQNTWEDACFTAIGYYLGPGGTMALSCYLGGEWGPGSYRVVKEVGGETLYAQFQLGESLYTAETPYGFVPLEELSQIPNVQGPVSPEGGPEDPAEFVRKVSLDVPCQLRLVQEDGEVTDVIYSNRHFLLRRLAEGQITQSRFSYLATDGQDLLLSNWVEWKEGREGTVILPEADLELVQMVQNITAAQLWGSSARFRIWAEDGEWDATLSETPSQFGVGWQKPGQGSSGRVFDLQYLGRPETAVLDLSWQEDNTLLLTCQTPDGDTSLLVFDPQSKQIK